MIKLIVLVLFFVARLTYGERCSVTQNIWTGYMREVNYNARGPQVAFRIARIDYNATGQKIHILEYSTEANGRREVADELYLFQKRKYYRAERGGGCHIEPLNEAFHDFGVPADAEFVGEEFLGDQSSTFGLLVNNFNHRDKRSGGVSAWYTFAPTTPFNADSKSCYPIEMSFVNTKGPLPFRTNVHFRFTNITVRIPEKAFDIPSSCNP